MHKQFGYMHLIDHKSDTLSLGGGFGHISSTSKQWAKQGSAEGVEFGGFLGGIIGIKDAVTGIITAWPLAAVFPILHLGDDWRIMVGPRCLIWAETNVGAAIGGAVGAVVGGVAGAAVGTAESLEHSGSGSNGSFNPSHGRIQGSQNSGPARRG